MGGGGGGGGENPTTQFGMNAAIVPFIALYGLVLMPKRWPAAFRQTLIWALVLAPIFTLFGPDAIFSGWGVFVILFLGWHISHKYMTHEHYRPNPRKLTPAQQQAAALAPYAHLRSAQAWREYTNKKDTT